MMTVGLQPGEKGPEPGLLVDLRRDNVRGVSRESAARAAVAERKIWFGALEGALEHEFLAPFLRLAPEGAPLLTTSALMAQGEAVALRAQPGKGAADWPVLPETAARARQALARGSVLVVSRSALEKGTLAWWEITQDGSTRPVLGDDWNGGSVKIPGVIPSAEGIGTGHAHLPTPEQRGRPEPGETGIERAPGEGPSEGGGGPGAGEGGEGTGGKGAASEEGGGANEYLAVILTQTIPDAFAVLQQYVDTFLVATNDLANVVSEVISSFLDGFL
jgi:hypothetical protein